MPGQRGAEIRVAQADEDTDVAAAEAHALVGDVAQRGEVVRQAAQRLQAGEDGVGGIPEQTPDQRQLARQAGAHVGRERLPQVELEIALQVDEVINVDAQIRQFYRAEDAIDADLQVDVLEEVQPVAQPLRRRERQVRDQTGHHLQADRGRQDRRQRQIPQTQREVWQFGHAEELDIRERQREGRQRGEQRVKFGEVDRQVAEIDVGQIEQIQVGQCRQAGQRQARELHAPLRPAVDQVAQACNAELGQFQREAGQADIRQRRQAGEGDRRELQLPVVPSSEQPPQRRQAEPEIRQAQI